MPTLHRTIIRPIVTEQTSAAYQERKEYTFEVASGSTKHSIRNAIESLFGVKVERVWTSNVRGMSRKVGATTGRRNNWKKAIVTLRDGAIPIFENFEG
jgi:large subunit ribosomal protein L23